MTIARLAPHWRVAGWGRTGGIPEQEEYAHMESSHVAALQARHEGLEERLREELSRPAPDSTMIQVIKKQKLKIKEELAHI
jgi:hypothetical protein